MLLSIPKTPLHPLAEPARHPHRLLCLLTLCPSCFPSSPRRVIGVLKAGRCHSTATLRCGVRRPCCRRLSWLSPLFVAFVCRRCLCCWGRVRSSFKDSEWVWIKEQSLWIFYRDLVLWPSCESRSNHLWLLLCLIRVCLMLRVLVAVLAEMVCSWGILLNSNFGDAVVVC